jgi:XTP/dITP diphosphohydrolase
VIGGTLLVATRSAGKLREIKPLLAPLGLHLIDLATAGIPDVPDDQLETGDTFAENALAKARHYFGATGGLPTVADDSGIEVAALGGTPGVRSKRWSNRLDLAGLELDAANNAALVAALEGKSDRRARYVCVAAFVDAAGEIIERGETSGTIIDTPRGGGGFGYDPYFLSDELGVTFGEASMEDKARVSHRGRAFRALGDRLRELGGR